MKRKLLIPALTSLALAPTISMVGCNDAKPDIEIYNVQYWHIDYPVFSNETQYIHNFKFYLKFNNWKATWEKTETGDVFTDLDTHEYYLAFTHEGFITDTSFTWAKDWEINLKNTETLETQTYNLYIYAHVRNLQLVDWKIEQY